METGPMVRPRHLPPQRPPERSGRHMRRLAPAPAPRAGVSLAEEALRANGDMDRMDWKHVGQETFRRRQVYYRDQNSPEMRQADTLTATVMAGLSDGMRTRHAEELIENSLADRPGQRLPKGKDAAWFLDHLIHQGALYRHTDDGIHSPIPSFRRYLIEWGTKPARRATPEIEDVGTTAGDPGP